MAGSPVFLHNTVQFCDIEPMTNIASQLPTPSSSDDSSSVTDTGEDGAPVISMSTTFSLTALHRPQPPDIALLSKDSVYFYVHSDVLLDATQNGFRAMLPLHFADISDSPSILHVPEPSSVLNVILHAIYNISCAHYSPTFETLASAVDSLPIYGINPKAAILPSTPLFTLLLSQAPLFPIDLYALAAHHDIFELAVPTSSHLLGFPLSRVSDEVAQRMGPVYLKRLIFLQLGRAEALKRVLGPLPDQHRPTPACDISSQKQLSRVWALATAGLAWDIRPDLSTHSLELALRPLGHHLSCELCKTALNARVAHLIVQWATVKRTI
ncbi:hypothetical protein C8R47DRAFT_1107177 [Mycena vitilis]|nr:hypothetical protein C8R47DRAFT_1107177 [Mycena vitilis]